MDNATPPDGHAVVGHEELAAYLNWASPAVARTMSSRAEARRRQGASRPGDLPAPDGHIVTGKPRRRLPYWLRATIDDWNAERPSSIFEARNLPGGTKVCSKCHQSKPLDEFSMYADSRRDLPPRRISKCKACRTQAALDWNGRNPEKAAAATGRWHRRTRRRYKARSYGLTETELSALEAAQQGHCLICGDFVGDRLVIDHDHAEGHVRGLLCMLCNVGLGAFREDPRRMLAAIHYLGVGRRGVFDEKHRAGPHGVTQAVPEQPSPRERRGDRGVAAA